MLELKGIKKDYVTGNMTVHALKGVDLTFSSSEFVSILGPSGCGKTTLLNIIGGLDHYTDGELFIDGISTKNYTDRDWDTYRNHRIGFVFQSYNLIPHQTILENVELALSISGIEKNERVRRAKEALDKVGLEGLYKKKPNQLSGGQCQRVAIARALVNEPEILLADEPTGALDTSTSIQIMELIKEISKDCLVIMVTHNSELANKYSTRIINLLDGEVQADTSCQEVANCNENEEKIPQKSYEKPLKNVKKTPQKKSKLSLLSTFRLSARNLLSKMKRTLLVCLAGAIGIIGVASVLAVSTGVQNYIMDMQNDMLSGNPVTITQEAMNLSSLMSQAGRGDQMDAIKQGVENGYINVDATIDYLVSRGNSMSNLRVSNDITKEYIDYVNAMPKEYYSAIVMESGIDVGHNLYTTYSLSGYESAKNMSVASVSQVYNSVLKKAGYEDYSQYISALSESFAELPDNQDFILSQYDIIYGDKMASTKNEIVIVVDSDYELSDLLLAGLGYYSQDEFVNLVYKSTDDERYNSSLDKARFSYDELVGKSFVWYPNDTVFDKTDETSPLATINPFSYNAYAKDEWSDGIELTVTAILKQKDSVSYGCLDSGFYYTSALKDEILSANGTSQIVQYLKDNEKDSMTSMNYNSQNIGVLYPYSYYFDGVEYTEIGFAGNTSTSTLISSFVGQGTSSYTLSLRELGGCEIANSIKIYPVDFSYKDNVTEYLTKWNSDEDLTVNGTTIKADERADIVYSDNLSIVISLVNNLIDMVTTALVAFTALSLVVSTVMIAIITYVSVIERINEIGVIRSLGGRKGDVARLFNAETFIIGSISGLIGVGITYLLSAIINAIVNKMFGIATIATLTLPTALIMIAVSILLTMIAGIIPASLAAKKDPVEALRTE